MLHLPDAWVWDFWLADTGQEYHLFFLRASRALHDPERRHRRASVGHAVSADLRSWQLMPDALVPGDEPAFDDLATWTGSVVQAPGQAWHMFYAGVSRADNGLVQRIGLATSADLVTWHKQPGFPIITADPRWYETGAGITSPGATRPGATPGSSPAQQVAAGTCSSPPARRPAPPTTAASSAMPPPATCSTGRYGRRSAAPAPASAISRYCR